MTEDMARSAIKSNLRQYLLKLRTPQEKIDQQVNGLMGGDKTMAQVLLDDEQFWNQAV